MRFVLLSLFGIASVFTYSVWYAKSWPSRLEAAATRTVEAPRSDPQVIELHGFQLNSHLVVDLAMSEPVTVAVPLSDKPGQFAAFRAASGDECDEAASTHQHWFVMMGLYDHCLTRRDIKKSKNALVLKYLQDHSFRNGGIAVSFITPSRDPLYHMENDDAWVVELYERFEGTEKLLGRGVATELLTEGDDSEFIYWPDFPEIQGRQLWLKELDKRSWALPVEDRHSWKTKSSYWPIWADDRVYLPVRTLAYALLEHGLRQKLHRQWLAKANPDPFRVLDYAESQFSSMDKERKNIGANILHTLRSWASYEHEYDLAVKETILKRTSELGMNF